MGSDEIDKADKSELLWHLTDYEAAGIPAPEIVRSNPQLCEGDLMNQEEVDEFIKDSIATLRILADKASPRYLELVQTFRLDLAALLQLGRIGEDEYNGLIEDTNLTF